MIHADMELVNIIDAPKDRNMISYTNGAYVMPVKLGIYWMWVVVGFEDDTFYDGECMNTENYNTDKSKLLIKEED